MGLAKKGTRQLRIGDTQYRWLVSPDDGFMRIVIEKSEEPGQRLSVHVGYFDESSDSGKTVQMQRITPDLIGLIILRAAALGWTPNQRATEFVAKLVGDDLLPLR